MLMTLLRHCTFPVIGRRKHENKEGEWGADHSRDRILYGDLRFIDSKVITSHLVPIGEPEAQRAVRDTFRNKSNLPAPYRKSFTHGETHRKLSQKSFNAGLRIEIEQMWEVGGEASQAKTGGRYLLETSMNWGTVNEDEYTENAQDESEISVEVPGHQSIEISQHREKTKMRCDIETFYIFDALIGFGGWHKPHGTGLWHNDDIQKIKGHTDRLFMSRSVNGRNGIDDLYEILSGISPRYPGLTKNYLKTSKKARDAYEWFADENNRSMTVKDSFEIENGYASTAELNSI